MGKPENVKYGWEFGLGRVDARLPFRRGRKPTSEKLGREEAWAHSCPVPDEVMKEYGPEWTLERYSNCDEVFGDVVNMAAEVNFPLYFRLTDYTPRVDGEYYDKKLKKKYIPKDFWKEMSPMTTPWGYAMPRMILLTQEKGNEVDKTIVDRIIREEVTVSKNPIGLTLKIGERLLEHGVSGKKLIYHLMSAGILKEEGCKTMYREILGKMTVEAPGMYREYLELTENIGQMKKDGIISPDELK